MADNSQAAAAMREGMADAQRRIDFYGVRPGQGVPAGTTGSDPQPITLPEDRAVTGVHGGGDAA
jgi:hypothetical protein